MIDDLPGIDAEKKETKKDTFAGHVDYKTAVKNVIIELNLLEFRRDEVIDKAVLEKIPKEQAEAAFDELLEDKYIHERIGTDGIYSLTSMGDYSPASESLPDW
ncbi:MAG: hypothetical protein QF475_00895 [Candidatus Undinarchaeales archaeon]|jgi:hypothetical protein|nr:hypothetical protein [Candidatus Undinarchaeales archaeon]